MIAKTDLSEHQFAYSSDCLSLESETIIAGGVTRVITREHDAFGRNSGFSLDNDYTVTYGYDAFGRFSAVTSSVFSASSAVNYSRLPDSDPGHCGALGALGSALENGVYKEQVICHTGCRAEEAWQNGKTLKS